MDNATGLIWLAATVVPKPPSVVAVPTELMIPATLRSFVSVNGTSAPTDAVCASAILATP